MIWNVLWNPDLHIVLLTCSGMCYELHVVLLTCSGMCYELHVVLLTCSGMCYGTLIFDCGMRIHVVCVKSVCGQ